jgi:hypothetical protein
MARQAASHMGVVMKAVGMGLSSKLCLLVFVNNVRLSLLY